MSGRSPRPDFGRTDYRFKINDNFGMLHETTLGEKPGMVDISAYFLYNTVIVMRRSAVDTGIQISNFWYSCEVCVISMSEGHNFTRTK